MNRGPFLFLGVFFILALSFSYTVYKPIYETGELAAVVDDEGRKPGVLPGLAQQGEIEYRKLGCVACHTQQTRLVSGSDIERNWGSRQSVARDYINQERVLIGDRRIGPDLSNVGLRLEDDEWHLLHFYNPRSVIKGSNMPGYAYLYETRNVVGERSDRALDLPEGFEVEAGYEVVPTRRAEALTAYMLSLKTDYELDEAPSPEMFNFVSE